METGDVWRPLMVPFVSRALDGERGAAGEAAEGVVGLLRYRRRRPGGAAEELAPPQPPAGHPDGGEVAGRLPADPTLRVPVRRRGGGGGRGRVMKLKQGEGGAQDSSPSSLSLFSFFSFLTRTNCERLQERSTFHQRGAAPLAQQAFRHGTFNWDRLHHRETHGGGGEEGLHMQTTFGFVFEFQVVKEKRKTLSIDVNACGCLK